MLPPSSSHTAPPPNRLLLRFILVASVLLLVWFFGYERNLAIDGRLDAILCSNIAAAGAGLLRIVGFTAAVSSADSQLLLLAGQPAVSVGPPCNGLILYALFAGFVLAYPGPWGRKLWYIPLGIVVIWGLNVMRVALLALNHQYAPSSLDFNHHYTFTAVVYACIFGLWMLWARRFALTKSHSSSYTSTGY